MEGELIDLYGKRVHIFYRNTLVQEAAGGSGPGLLSQTYSGLEGTLERDTENFIFLRDVQHKIVKRAVRSDGTQSTFVVAKEIVSGLYPDLEEVHLR